MIQTEQQKIPCPNCKVLLVKPSYPHTKCPKCSHVFMSFCHSFPLQEFTELKCKEPDCSTRIYYFFCTKCSCLVTYPNFRMGTVSSCPRCKFKVIYVRCTCGKVERFPPDRIYEGKIWKCNECERPIQFIICDNCLRPRYTDSGNFGAKEQFVCGSQQIAWQVQLAKKCKFSQEVKGCGARNIVKTCSNCENIFAVTKDDERALCLNCHHTKIGTQIRQNRGDRTNQSQLNTCKICLDNDSQFINLTCFHLCVCHDCLGSIKDKCPVCRSVGKYQKVFRA